MCSNVLHIILNQDRYHYYNYHQICGDGDRIVCFYDAEGRIPDRKELPPNVEVVQFEATLTEEAVLDSVESFLSQGADVNVVCTEDKYFLLAARLREKLGSTGMDKTTAEFFRSKTEMKKVVSGIGVSVPKWECLSEIGSYEEGVAKLGSSKLIIKPKYGYGSRDTYIVHNSCEFEALDIPDRACFEVEEFVSGTLYHIDSIHFKGRVIYSVVFEYSFPNIEYKQGKNIGSLEVLDSSSIKKKLQAIDEKIAAHTGQNYVSHLEVFYSQGEAIFLEVQARPPGLLLVPLHRLIYGVDLSIEAAKMQMLPGYCPQPSQSRKAYGTYFSMGRPDLASVKNIHEPEIKSNVEFFRVGLKRGENSQPGKSLRESGAVYLLSSNDPEVIARDFSYLKEFRMFT